MPRRVPVAPWTAFCHRAISRAPWEPLRAGVARGEPRPGTDCESESVDMPARLRGFLDRLLRDLSPA
ncbi:hypothetical protein [Streptomyces erythrochromogenes]|uniref:hypothetical protein n=1 Tax=Streptomyces erythrochromogenes TaxID=285574 RepID=UPI0038092443